MVKRDKIKTPEWILKDKEEPKAQKKGKTFKIRTCPKCGSEDVGVLLGSEEGEWECHKCKWKGKDIVEKELSENEFMKYLDEKGEEVA